MEQLATHGQHVEMSLANVRSFAFFQSTSSHVNARCSEAKDHAKGVKDCIKEIGNDPSFADERKALQTYADVLEKQSVTKTKRKKAQEELDAKIDSKYPTLKEGVAKTLVVEDKQLAALNVALHGELDRVSQQLTTRVSSDRGTAILVAASIYDACHYFRLFQNTTFGQYCGIITSHEPAVAT